MIVHQTPVKTIRVKKGSRENLFFLERKFCEISFTIDREKGRKNFPVGKVNQKSKILNQQGVEKSYFSIQELFY